MRKYEQMKRLFALLDLIRAEVGNRHVAITVDQAHKLVSLNYGGTFGTCRRTTRRDLETLQACGKLTKQTRATNEPDSWTLTELDTPAPPGP